MEKNSISSKEWIEGWRRWGMVSTQGTVSGSLIQKIWWWISRKEVKLKFVVELDEAELDNIIWEAIGREEEIFAKECVESVKPKPKSSNKQSKSGRKPKGEAVRTATKSSGRKSKKI